MLHTRVPRSRRVLVAGLLLAAVLLAAHHPALPVQAATFAVTSTADAVDASPGDGMCATAMGEGCTLRAAIQEANAAPGADLIRLPAGVYALTLIGYNEDAAATGDLDLTDDVTLVGAGAAITSIAITSSSDPAFLTTDRVLDVAAGVTAALTGVTIRDGWLTNGGGIRNAGDLTLTDVSISNNRVTFPFALGGGIANERGAQLTLIDSTVSGNSANDLSTTGGGIYNAGVLTLTNSTVSGNTALGRFGSGGGIANVGTLTLTESTISGNRALGRVGEGGGIYNTGTLILPTSTISGNTASGSQEPGGRSRGGGISNTGMLTLTQGTISGNRATGTAVRPEVVFRPEGGGIYNAGTLTLTNGTISGNRAEGRALPDEGGGMYNTGTLTLTHATISDNTTDDATAAALHHAQGTVTATNTLVAHNGTGANCSGLPLTSAGQNLDSGTTCGFTAAGDLVATDPRLGPLADNGGPTATHLPLPGSPAIDAGRPDCPPPATDQRGVVRPQDGDSDGRALCDIGAVEVAAVTCFGRVPTIRGSGVLRGTPGNDVILGSAGSDVIDGGGGDDAMCGGGGDDILAGGPGSDRLDGGAGTDLCDGGPGSDTAVACERVTAVP